MRDSQPVISGGHAADSAGNAGNQYVPGPRELAYRHESMRNADTAITPFANLKPDQNGGYLGVMAMSHAQRQSAMLQTQEPKDVTVGRQDHAGQAGTGNFRAAPSGNPQRQPAHTALGTPGQGIAGIPAHTLDNPTSRAMPGMKNSEALSVIKAAMRGQGIGA
jgi:hypothetical protein